MTLAIAATGDELNWSSQHFIFHKKADITDGAIVQEDLAEPFARTVAQATYLG